MEILSYGQAEHDLEGNYRDRLRRNFFQNPETGTGDGGRQTLGGGTAVGLFFNIEAYYNWVCLHSALDYVAPNVFNLGQAV